uniref:CCHC-type domain-containing protein n=1 Tax=Arundo donax TaxID=35708 RepID=A0A0A9HMU9_ARUDO
MFHQGGHNQPQKPQQKAPNQVQGPYKQLMLQQQQQQRYNFQQQRPNTQPQQQNRTGPGSGSTIGPCFHYGELGHLANRCPKKQQGQARAQGNSQQQLTVRIRVNHVLMEEAEDAPEVVMGTFSINSHPVTVLFDSGATYSFISSQFVTKHNLPRALMKVRMLVSFPGGEMESRHACPRININIRG